MMRSGRWWWEDGEEGGMGMSAPLLVRMPAADQSCLLHRYGHSTHSSAVNNGNNQRGKQWSSGYHQSTWLGLQDGPITIEIEWFQPLATLITHLALSAMAEALKAMLSVFP